MKQTSQGREYYRVSANVRVFFCLDTLEARQDMVADYEIWSAQPPPDMPENLKTGLAAGEHVPPQLKTLYTMIQWLNFKMDIVIHQLRIMSRGRLFNNQLTTTDLSITGFGFASQIDAPVGSKLLMALHLPDAPTHPVYTTGTLVRNGDDNKDGQSMGAVVFEKLTDADSERIARFTFDSERKLKLKGS